MHRAGPGPVVTPFLEAPLPSLDDTLQYVGDVATDATFTVAGRYCLVVGGEARGVDHVWVHGRRVVQDLRLEGATADGFRATPIGVERRFRVDGREGVERIFVPRDLAAVIIEWQALEGAELSLSWRTDLRGPAGGAATSRGRLDREREGRMLRIRRGGDDVVAAFVTSGESPAWEVDEVRGDDGPVLGIRLRFELGAGESVRLAVAATSGDEDALATILAALRPDDLVRARRAARRVLQRERLTLSAPDAHVGAALEWAKVRLDTLHAERLAPGRWLVTGDPGAATAPGWAARVAHGGNGGVLMPSDAAQAALAALACGDFDAARRVLRALGGLLMPPAGPGAGAASPSSAAGRPQDPLLAYLLLVARYVAWTGELGLVREEWDRVRAAYACVVQSDVEVGRREAVRRELAATAESIGLGLPDATPADRSGAAGATAGDRFDSLLVQGSQDPLITGGRDPVAGGDGPEKRGPSTPSGEAVDPAGAVAAVSSLVHGLLGVEPDAAKGRLRLRPAIPEAWDRLDVQQLRIGDASIDVAYRREGDRHTFRIDQTSGAVPVTLIFEPLLVARRLVAARIDGQTAELDPRPHNQRMLVPVQLVLDAERVVELDVAHDLGPQPRGLRVWRQ